MSDLGLGLVKNGIKNGVQQWRKIKAGDGHAGTLGPDKRNSVLGVCGRDCDEHSEE